MDDKKLNIGINEIRKIVMTDAEKKRIYDNILNSPAETKLVKSPWFSHSFIFMTNRSKFAYYIIIPLLFILSGGGVVFASEGSLPNGILYPLKVKVVEPIEGALKFSAKAKAIHESNLASKRLIEAETLASKDKLDTFKEKEINNLLAKHTEALNNALNKVDRSNSKDNTEFITTNFRAEMNAHARILDTLGKNESNNQNEENEDAIQQKNITISNTARVSAEKIKNNIKTKDEDNKIEKYKVKKTEVESLIGKVDQVVVSDNLNKKRNKNFVVEDTQKTINQAKAYLSDADKKDKEGNLGEAYSSLLDSESSVKEAKIFFDTSLKINQNKGNNHKDKAKIENDDN